MAKAKPLEVDPDFDRNCDSCGGDGICPACAGDGISIRGLVWTAMSPAIALNVKAPDRGRRKRKAASMATEWNQPIEKFYRSCIVVDGGGAVQINSIISQKLIKWALSNLGVDLTAQVCSESTVKTVDKLQIDLFTVENLSMVRSAITSIETVNKETGELNESKSEEANGSNSKTGSTAD